MIRTVAYKAGDAVRLKLRDEISWCDMVWCKTSANLRRGVLVVKLLLVRFC